MRWFAGWFAGVAIVILILVSPPRVAGDGPEPDGLMECVRDNFPERSVVATVSFRARDRSGALRESGATLHWRKEADGLSKLMLRVSDPPKLRGAGLLFIERPDRMDRFLYLPALRKVRRITKSSASTAVLDTDFTYEDLERIQRLRQEREWVELSDSVVFDRPVRVVETRPDPAISAYVRIVAFVDAKTCVVLKSEYYERGDQLRKVLTADPDKITQEGDLFIARSLLMRDLREESSTEFVLEHLEIGASIEDRVFSRTELAVGRR